MKFTVVSREAHLEVNINNKTFRVHVAEKDNKLIVCGVCPKEHRLWENVFESKEALKLCKEALKSIDPKEIFS